jgi:hypothetical protein
MLTLAKTLEAMKELPFCPLMLHVSYDPQEQGFVVSLYKDWRPVTPPIPEWQETHDEVLAEAVRKCER